MAVAASLLLASGSARADDDTKVPSFARYKPVVDDLEHKEEGNFFSGLPLVGYDSNTGLGLGLGGYFTMDGKRTDALFPVTPYRHRLFLQGYATTGGYQQHVLSYDGIYIRDTPYRVRAQLMFERNTNANYFGVGERTLGPLSFRGITHSTWDEQVGAASALQPDGTASPNFNHYEYDTPSAAVTLERDFWGGRIRAQYGFTAQYTWIKAYDGTQTTDPNGNPAVHGPTRLGIDCAARLVLGCPPVNERGRLLPEKEFGTGGGWNNMLKAGIAFDTRDFEPDPTKGIFADAVGEWSSRAFGSAFDYLRFTVTARGYWSPFPKLANIVLAVRLLYSIQTGNVPFYMADVLAMTEGDQNGLGGERTLRGFRQDRFIGPVAALGNAELRWTFVHFKLLQQRFSLQIAPLIDVGTVFDNVGFQHTTCTSDCWKVSGGAGLRVGWNRSSIIMFDFGASSEDIGFYIDFGMPF